jgi:MoaA/NifB/PqqE/SkfB family radical SAM enzyme
MCDIFKYPSKINEELTLDDIRKLPDNMAFVNITGGEPFVREDLPEIVENLMKKSKRVVVSTNGWFSDRIISLCERFPNVGVRVSLEGLEFVNDEIRQLPNGFKRAVGTLKQLVRMGVRDIGFGMTVQDKNCGDLVPLYVISDELGIEFATSAIHNSFYFHKDDNGINDKFRVAQNFEELINRMLNAASPKKWFRAYFNHGLINYIYGNKRLLPCEMAKNAFFVDPYGDVVTCNGSDQKSVMGNIRDCETFDEIWRSQKAKAARGRVKLCDKNCWMIGSAAPSIYKYFWIPVWWVVKNKLLNGGKYSIYENKFINDGEGAGTTLC